MTPGEDLDGRGNSGACCVEMCRLDPAADVAIEQLVDVRSVVEDFGCVVVNNPKLTLTEENRWIHGSEVSNMSEKRV